MRDGNKTQSKPIAAATVTDTYVKFETPRASKMAPAIRGKIAIFAKDQLSIFNHLCIKIAPPPRLANDDLK